MPPLHLFSLILLTMYPGKPGFPGIPSFPGIPWKKELRLNWCVASQGLATPISTNGQGRVKGSGSKWGKPLPSPAMSYETLTISISDLIWKFEQKYSNRFAFGIISTWPLPSCYHHLVWCLSYTFDSCSTDHSSTLFKGLLKLQT